MKRVLIISLMMALTVSAIGNKKTDSSVVPYDGHTPMSGEVLYALPMLDMYVDIATTCTISVPGPFAQYAERYLASTDAIIHHSRVWNFNGADVCGEFLIDTTKLYLINNENKRLVFDREKPFLVSVGEWQRLAGMPRDGRADGVMPREECPEQGKPLEIAPCSRRLGEARPEQMPRDIRPEIIDTLFHTELLGEEALTSTSIPKMAERAAKQIFQLREARMAILTCDVAHQPDGNATREILERIDRVERELTALFVGKRATITTHRRFRVDPTAELTNNIIARVSTVEGLCDADEMIGEAVYLDVKPITLQAPDKQKREKKAQKGYFYNVPGAAIVTIRHGDYAKTKVEAVPQNGYAIWLSPKTECIKFTRLGTIEEVR